MKKHQYPRYAGALCSVIVAGLSACGTMTRSNAHATLSFNFEFQGDFVGNATAQQAVITAGHMFSSMFATHFTNSAVLDLTVTSYEGFAAAGSDSVDAPGFGNGEVVRNKILTGTDLNGSAADGSIFINFAIPFVFNPNAPVDFGSGQIDFFSVMDHELTHALGWSSNINPAGDTPGAFSKWDQFLTSKAGVLVVDSTTMLVNHKAYSDAQTNGGVFNGSNAVAAWGSPVPLIKDPDISHLDQDTFSTPNIPFNYLMRGTGTPPDFRVPRDYMPAEVGILADIGYTRVAAVPEPSTYALMLVGMGMLGFAAKRRKS